MRETKYKAWDTANKIWLDTSLFNIRLDNGLLQRNECAGTIGGVEIVEYTGLKDKNGVEIYEGDIFHWVFDKREGFYFFPPLDAPPNHLVECVSEIKFLDGVFVVWTDGGEHIAPLKGDIDRTQLGEVIGNIWEDKELLDE